MTIFSIVDSLGNTIENKQFNRIISLVPSWTEFICDLGLEKLIIARTIYCVLPNSLKSLPIIGGTKNPNIKKIVSMKPDIIIANKEENKQYDINRMRNENLSVFVSSGITIAEIIDEIFSIEKLLTNHLKLSRKIYHNVNNFAQYDFNFAYLVWFDPIIVAGEHTYISKSLEHLGGRNIIPKSHQRYPKFSIEKLRDLNPEIIFLPDEPFNFSHKHKILLAKMCKKSKIWLLDGKIFSWYGKRLENIEEEFQRLMEI